MKSVLAAAAVLAALSVTPAFAIANPASQACDYYGGETIIVSDYEGNQYGLCHLPDGHIIEEWTFLRMQQERQPIYVYPQGEHYKG